MCRPAVSPWRYILAWLEEENAAKSNAKKRKNKDDKNLPSDDAKAAGDRFRHGWFVCRYRRQLGRK